MLGQKSEYPGDERPQSSAGSFGKQRILVILQYFGTCHAVDVTVCVQLKSLHRSCERVAAAARISHSLFMSRYCTIVLLRTSRRPSPTPHLNVSPYFQRIFIFLDTYE